MSWIDVLTVKENCQKTWLKGKSYDKLFCYKSYNYCTEHFSQRIDSSIVKRSTRMHHSTVKFSFSPFISWPPNLYQLGEQTQNHRHTHRQTDYYNSWPPIRLELIKWCAMNCCIYILQTNFTIVRTYINSYNYSLGTDKSCCINKKIHVIVSTKTESVSYACREYKGSKQRDCLVSYHIEMQPSNCQEIIRDDIRDKAH